METFSPQPARLLDLVRTDLEQILSMLRPKFAPLQVERTARHLGLVVEEHRFQGPVRGATVEDSLVLLDDRLSGSLRAEVFAHEVGHVLHRRGFFRPIPEHKAELFADQFARELLVPAKWLVAERASGELIARQLRVSRSIIALQLAARGAAPPLMRDRKTVLCATCGIWPHGSQCKCRRFRQDPRFLRRLPDFRSLPAFDPPAPPQLDSHDQLTFASKYFECAMKVEAN